VERVKGAIQWGNKITVAFIILFTLLTVFMPSFSMVEPFRDYLVHVLMAMMILGFLGLILSSRSVMFSGFGCAMLLAIFLKNASNTELKNAAINQNVQLKVAHINLSLLSDPNMIAVFMAKDTLIDVYSFQEYTPDWASLMPTIMAKYPFKYEDVQIDVFGKAVFSKTKIDSMKRTDFGGVKALDIQVNKDNKVFRLVSAYLIPALNSSSVKQAKLQLNAMENDFRNDKNNLVLLGEFNQVYWSSDIMDFRKNTQLLNSRRNVNISDPKMPYDHIFYSPKLECTDFGELSDSTNLHIGCTGAFQIKDNSLRN
jgi:endonuclease/exonuclease/phosphatase (EEP) superfamily protein YafD